MGCCSICMFLSKSCLYGQFSNFSDHFTDSSLYSRNLVSLKVAIAQTKCMGQSCPGHGEEKLKDTAVGCGGPCMPLQHS
ncbi:hypothetical protein Syun_020764 [Stephania yunnanensis]|uniref:Uncharacterized protein n=1 Tax=Stephania yunnanensis TaxID=152371 RepID=A0AAP0IET7_9MAGN